MISVQHSHYWGYHSIMSANLLGNQKCSLVTLVYRFSWLTSKIVFQVKQHSVILHAASLLRMDCEDKGKSNKCHWQIQPNSIHRHKIWVLYINMGQQPVVSISCRVTGWYQTCIFSHSWSWVEVFHNFRAPIPKI